MVEILTIDQFWEREAQPAPEREESAAFDTRRYIRTPGNAAWVRDGNFRGDENFIVANTNGISTV